jgi:hypothetical protein
VCGGRILGGVAGEDRRIEPEAERDAARRRRMLDAVFGDVLPEVTSDEVPEGESAGRDDRWYLENRPPHH